MSRIDLRPSDHKITKILQISEALTEENEQNIIYSGASIVS